MKLLKRYVKKDDVQGYVIGVLLTIVVVIVIEGVTLSNVLKVLGITSAICGVSIIISIVVGTLISAGKR